MPVYDYKCVNDHVVEIEHSMTDERRFWCGRCSKPLKKVMTAPVVSFNGEGFYSTDKNK